MKIAELNIPEFTGKALFLAVFTDEVIMGGYVDKTFFPETIKSVRDSATGEKIFTEFVKEKNGLQQLHIFDKTQEYRALKSGNLHLEKTFRDEMFPENEAYISIEDKLCFWGDEWISSGKNVTVLKEKGQEREFYFPVSEEDFKKGLYIKVVNYLKYDENNMLNLAAYRLAGVCAGGVFVGLE